MDNEVHAKVIPLLRVFAEQNTDAANTPNTTHDDPEELIRLLNVDRLVEDKSFHGRPIKQTMYLCKLMQIHGVDYKGTLFQELMQFLAEYLNARQLVHKNFSLNNWEQQRHGN